MPLPFLGVRRFVPRLLFLALAAAPTASALKVTVLGGSGFVGSRVCKTLVDAGAEVVSLSASGAAPCSEEWTKAVVWRKNNLLRGPREQLIEAMGQPDAVVSAVGVIGFDVQGSLLGNGVANAEGAKAAKAAGASRFVYVSVASDVTNAKGWLPLWGIEGYFDGKAQAEQAILDAGFKATTFVRPSFIYGGDSFGLFPPRVNAAYGSAVEELLSAGPIVALANALPGLLKVALRPPVSVDAVAGAAAAAALGKLDAVVLDGTPSINEAAGQPKATGLSDFINGIKDKLSSATA